MPQLSEYQRLLTAVTTDPEDDDARLAFAAHIRSSDPARAQFIEEQIAEATKRRLRRGYPDSLEHPLLAKHGSRWSHTLAKYARSWRYDRGFIAEVELDPYIFLEYGEWLFINEPIRDVNFVPPEGGPFPMDEIAASPLLSHLDAVGFKVPDLCHEDLVTFSASPHLTRLLYLSGNAVVAERTYEALAAAPSTRKVLMLLFGGTSFPGVSLEATEQDDYWGAPIWGWRAMTPTGKRIEQRHGYIPWLHGKDNDCYPLDASWFVSQGILPVKQPGSPVDGEEGTS